MNDIRNLMDNLHTHLEYQEFDTAARAPADSWAVLDRISRATAPMAAAAAAAAPVAAFVPTPAPVPAAPLPSRVPTAAPEPAAAFFPARSDSAPARRLSRSLLGRYAASGAPDAAESLTEAERRLPLTDVFAKLARAGR